MTRPGNCPGNPDRYTLLLRVEPQAGLQEAGDVHAVASLSPRPGSPSGACPGYVVDHIVALKRGGADASLNTQWQTIGAAKAKDKWE